jgi:hypothetical protein
MVRFAKKGSQAIISHARVINNQSRIFVMERGHLQCNIEQRKTWKRTDVGNGIYLVVCSTKVFWTRTAVGGARVYDVTPHSVQPFAKAETVMKACVLRASPRAHLLRVVHVPVK